MLGPLRVTDGVEEFALGGAKQRGLLAILIAAAGTPVSMDSLIMGVYGPDASSGVRRSIQTYVSTLRRTFGGLIDRERAGYVLSVDLLAIDAVRFEKNLEKARATVDEGISTQALRDALALWRGRPYSDIEATTVLEAEISRLEQLRIEALDALIELELAFGRHRVLISELDRIVAEFPTQESFRAHQMMALYRSGRQADALDVYQQTSTLLLEEFGLDPSPDLQRLEELILAQDESLAYRPSPRARPLPVRYTSFLGRAAESSHLTTLIRSHRLVTVTGPGGIGKSSLAIETARGVADEMAVVYVGIEEERAANPIDLIAQSVGLRLDPSVEALTKIIYRLERRPTLLLLDGCEHVIDKLPRVLSDLLRSCESLRILLTSREALFITGENRYELRPLTVGPGSESDLLFVERAEVALDGLDDDQRRQVTTIGTWLDGIPLAVELAAAQLRTMTVTDIASRLDTQTDLLMSRRSADERHQSIVSAIDWGYGLLDVDAQTAFRRLAVFRNGISEEGARFVLEDGNAARLLNSLCDQSFLVPDGERTYQILEPLRQYGWMRLDNSGELEAVRMRHARWTVERCNQIQRQFEIERSAEGLKAIRREGPEILATADWALENGEPEIALGVVASVGRFWPKVLDGGALRRTARRALAHPNSPDGELATRALAKCALMYREHDQRYSAGVLPRLADLAEGVKEPETRFVIASTRAALRYSLANQAAQRTDRAELLRLQELAIETAAESGHPPEGQLYNLSIMLLAAGRIDEAEDAVDRLVLWADETKPVDHGDALTMSGVIAQVRGDFDEVAVHAREATTWYLEAGDFDSAAEAERQGALALALLRKGDQAKAAVRRADDLHEIIGLPPVEEVKPELTALIAATNSDWEEFEAAMRTWTRQVSSNHSERRQWLEGRPDMPSHLVLLLLPMAEWLVAGGESLKAARVCSALEMTLASTKYGAWRFTGELERTRALAKELDTPSSGVPGDLESLFGLMVDLVTSD